VHGTEEVTLTVEAEFKVLGHGFERDSHHLKPVFEVGRDAPDGGVGVVAGLIDDEDARSIAGIAGWPAFR